MDYNEFKHVEKLHSLDNIRGGKDLGFSVVKSPVEVIEESAGGRARSDMECPVRILQELLRLCSPAAHARGESKFIAGYRKYMVLTWLIRPEVCDNRNKSQMAKYLGIGRSRFYDILKELKEEIESLGAVL